MDGVALRVLKQKPMSVSLDLSTQEVKLSVLRGHKYFRAVKQVKEREQLSKPIMFLLIKKIKKAKTLKSFTSKTSLLPNKYLKQGVLQSALKRHQRLHHVDLSKIPYQGRDVAKSLFSSMKTIKTISIPHHLYYLKNLYILRNLENLCINLKSQQLEADLLYNTLSKLTSLKNLCVEVFSNCLGKLLCMLNKFSLTFESSLKFQILTKDEHDENHLSGLSTFMLQKITKLSLCHMNSTTGLTKVFSKQPFPLKNLHILKLGFTNVPELEFVRCLKYLNKIVNLKKLSLSFVECWDAKLMEQVMKNLQLPSLLQDLKITATLSFKHFFEKYMKPSENQKKKEKNKHSWRETNLFEEEALFISFFNTIQQTSCLKKLELVFQMIEPFNSYYTYFFISILNRLPNLSSIFFHVTDCSLQEDLTPSIPEGFDLSLLFQACSSITNLQNLEVIMPNLLFEDAEINHTMPHLHKFTIGVNENEEGFFEFQNISKCITGWLKRLASIAPGLRSLNLDFIEVIDEPTFCKRFMLIERFKHLEAFSSRYKIEECSNETVKKVGRMLQSLQLLKTLVLNFRRSDKNLLEIKNYLNYKKSLREILVNFYEKNWALGSSLTEDEEFESLEISSTNEAIALELEDFTI